MRIDFVGHRGCNTLAVGSAAAVEAVVVADTAALADHTCADRTAVAGHTGAAACMGFGVADCTEAAVGNTGSLGVGSGGDLGPEDCIQLEVLEGQPDRLEVGNCVVGVGAQRGAAEGPHTLL